MLETLKNRFHAGDQVLSNYILQARLNQLLITRIISEQGRQQTLDTQVQACSKQQDANQQQIESLKTKADTLAKKLAAVKKENILLKDQINRIKQIDLNTKTTH